MNRKLIMIYQLLTGASDTCTGVMLMIAPGVALELMKLNAPNGDLVYLSYIGSFVFAVGLCGLYGFHLALRGDKKHRLGTVWLLTAILRASVSVFVLMQIVNSALTSGWISVAAFDGACVLIQGFGLQRGWVANASH